MQNLKFKRVKGNNANLIPGVLLLMTAILSSLSIDFDDYDWLDILPAILFAIAGLMYIFKFFKERKTAKQDG